MSWKRDYDGVYRDTRTNFGYRDSRADQSISGYGYYTDRGTGATGWGHMNAGCGFTGYLSTPYHGTRYHHNYHPDYRPYR